MREFEQAEVLAARALEVAEKHQFQYIAAICRGILGYARAQLGRAVEGVALIREAMAGFLEIRSRIGINALTPALAVAQACAGAVGDALETVEQALQDPYDPYRPFARLPYLRIRGALRLHQGQAELGEADFRDAIGMARDMGGKTSELGATMGLARLLAQHGRRDEARAMLAEIYNWFTEGFDTADLKEAKALLTELEG